MKKYLLNVGALYDLLDEDESSVFICKHGDKDNPFQCLKSSAAYIRHNITLNSGDIVYLKNKKVWTEADYYVIDKEEVEQINNNNIENFIYAPLEEFVLT